MHNGRKARRARPGSYPETLRNSLDVYARKEEGFPDVEEGMGTLEDFESFAIGEDENGKFKVNTRGVVDAAGVETKLRTSYRLPKETLSLPEGMTVSSGQLLTFSRSSHDQASIAGQGDHSLPQESSTTASRL
jgi:hypothetical protein